MSALQAFVMEAMGDDAPAFSGLLREIREQALRAAQARARAGVAEPASSAPSGDGAPAGSTPAGPAAGRLGRGVGLPERARRHVHDGQRGRDHGDEGGPVLPRGRRPRRDGVPLVRAVRWGALAAPPPTGKIPAPPPARRNALADMLAAGNHAVLVARGRGAFRRTRSTSGSTSSATSRRRSRRSARRPPPPTPPSTTRRPRSSVGSPPSRAGTFHDGTSFADPMTRHVALRDRGVGGEGGGPAEASPSDRRRPGRPRPGGRRRRARRGAGLMAGAGAPRDAFERAVAAAELCFAAGRPDVGLGAPRRRRPSAPDPPARRLGPRRGGRRAPPALHLRAGLRRPRPGPAQGGAGRARRRRVRPAVPPRPRARPAEHAAARSERSRRRSPPASGPRRRGLGGGRLPLGHRGGVSVPHAPRPKKPTPADGRRWPFL